MSYSRGTPYVFHVADFGALADPSTGFDQTGVQAACDAAYTASPGYAAGGPAAIVQFGPGLYRMNAELLLNSVGFAGNIILRGSGKDRTVLSWVTDLGSNKWAIRAQDYLTTPGGGAVTVEHLTIDGPHAAGGVGTHPAQMHGFAVQNQWRIRSVKTAGFNAGATLRNDHIRFEDFDAGGNYYGVYILNGQSDIHFVECNLTTNKMASIGFHPNGEGIGAGEFTSVNFGFSPFGFYFEPGRTGSLGLGGCVFTNCGWENLGNAHIADPDRLANLETCEFHVASGGNYYDLYKLAGAPFNAAIDVGSIIDCSWFSGGPSGHPVGPPIRTQVHRNLEIHATSHDIPGMYNSNRPLIVATNLAGAGQRAGNCKMWIGISEIDVRYCNTTVTQYSLVQLESDGVFGPNTVGGFTYGVALHDCTAGGHLAVATKGHESLLVKAATGTVRGPLVADPSNPTRVMTAPSSGTRAIVGWAEYQESGGLLTYSPGYRVMV